MTRKTLVLLCTCVLALAFPSFASAAADDNAPGVPIVPSGTTVSLDSAGDTDDVFAVWLSESETLSARISAGTPGFAPQLVLYGPSTTDIWNLRQDYVAISRETALPRSIAFTAPVAGYYYLDVYQSPFADPPIAGSVRLDWSVAHPVHRFYNSRAGTHFYTASETERGAVIATLSSIYQYEGVAYNTDPYSNPAPLYRFYRPSTGTHFYTASEAEKNNVVANLSRTYSLDGAAYNVSTTPVPGATTVWRFYRRNTGTHFYTADPAERQSVQNNLGAIYTYEGPAFYIAP